VTAYGLAQAFLLAGAIVAGVTLLAYCIVVIREGGRR